MPVPIHPADGGMLYTETNLHHLFPEPWNMITSAFFLIPAFYWLIKLKGYDSRFQFLSIASWLLLVGCIGGTIYHGLRRWHIFIFMDWLPIALLCLMASVYFWIKVLGKWYHGLLALLLFIGVEALLRTSMHSHNMQLSISINYGVMVLMIILPLTLFLVKTKGHNWPLIILALCSFAVALFFRVADSWPLLQMGTHFLWHTFGAGATTLMFIYLYRIQVGDM
jgi:hemolysin III